MKRGGLFLICLFLLLLIIPGFIVADETTQNLESEILESFDPETKTTEWLVVGSKFVTQGTPRTAYTKAWPEAVFGANRKELDLEVLAVNASFDRMGYNYLELIPVKKDDDGKYESNPITIPGRAKSIDLWVWGSNYDYYLEIHVRDFKGVVHVLNLGGLKYTGWKNLGVSIPGYIPQAGGYVTPGGYIKTLELVKIVLWTKPRENVSGFNVYFDQIKVLTDMFITRFDGDDLTDPEKVKAIWSSKGGE